MPEQAGYTCPICGEGTVLRRPVRPGYRFPLSPGREEEIPAHFSLKSCDKCGELAVTISDIRALEAYFRDLGTKPG